MQTLQFFPLTTKLNEYDIILFDLWGVIVEGDKTYPGVIEAINEIITKKKVYFVSNAPRPAFRINTILSKWGLEGITERMVLTAGDVARKIIVDSMSYFTDKKPVIFHLGADRNNDLLANFNHSLTSNINEAAVFLLSLYRDDYENIREFDNLLKEAADLNKLTICSNPDTTIPKNGITRYCAGYFAEIFEKFGGQVVYTGKPKKVIYNNLFEKEPKVKKDRVLMVGDTFETDILGAQNSNIHSALVLTGNAEKYHIMHEDIKDKLKALSNYANLISIKPTFVTKLA